jgi:hypothetical protein
VTEAFGRTIKRDDVRRQAARTSRSPSDYLVDRFPEQPERGGYTVALLCEAARRDWHRHGTAVAARVDEPEAHGGYAGRVVVFVECKSQARVEAAIADRRVLAKFAACRVKRACRKRQGTRTPPAGSGTKRKLWLASASTTLPRPALADRHLRVGPVGALVAAIALHPGVPSYGLLAAIGAASADGVWPL